MKYCKHCGAELSDEAAVCSKCGCSVASEYGEVQEPLKKNKLAIAGFVLSLVSLVLNLYAIPAVIGLVLSIVGLVQIKKGGYNNKGLAVAGIIISAVAIVWDVLYYAVIGPVIGQLFEELFNSIG